MKIGVVFDYYEVFGLEVPTDDLFFLRRYSTKNILLKIAEMNVIINNFSTEESNNKIFKEVLFGDLSIPKQIIPNYDSKLLIGTFFTSQHISELIKNVLINYTKAQEDNIPYYEFALDLFKSILIFNKKYNDRLKKDNNLKSFENLFALSVLQQGYIRSTKPFVSYVKFSFICRFLSINPELRDLTTELCEEYKIGSPWSICKFLLDLSYQPDKNNLVFVVDKKDIPANFLKEWYLYESFLSNQEKITLNFTIIPRPLFEISKDEVIILDMDYFHYTINQGFFYRFFGYNKKTIKDWNIFQSKIGKDYFEEFLCKLLLEKTFKHKNQLVYSDKKYQDFLIKSSTNDLLIFEVKMTSINTKTLEDFNFEKYKGDVVKNFLSQKEIHGKNVGVYQVISQIIQLKNSKNQAEIRELLEIKKISRLNIYPILLTDDVSYNILGTNNFINEQSTNAFLHLKKDFQSIKPVLILNVSTLIEYYGYFSSNKNCFTDLVKGYFKEISNHKRQYELYRDSYRYYMAMQPFDNYVQRKLKGKTIVEDFDIFKSTFDEELNFKKFTAL